jgi:hypothetical protein
MSVQETQENSLMYQARPVPELQIVFNTTKHQRKRNVKAQDK